MWDTGFYKESPCYAKMDIDIVNKRVAELQENVVEPYLRAKGLESYKEMGHKADDFWNGREQNFSIHTRKVYDTNDALEAMSLYFAIKTHRLAPKEYKGDARYNDTPYVLADGGTELKAEESKIATKYKTFGIFNEYLNTNKELLIAALAYNSVRLPLKVEDEALILLFDSKIAKDVQTMEQFTNTLAKAMKDTNFRDELFIHKALQSTGKHGKNISKNSKQMVTYKGQEIGPDLKSVAHLIATQDEFDSIKNEIILDED